MLLPPGEIRQLVPEAFEPGVTQANYVFATDGRNQKRLPSEKHALMRRRLTKIHTVIQDRVEPGLLFAAEPRSWGDTLGPGWRHNFFYYDVCSKFSTKQEVLTADWIAGYLGDPLLRQESLAKVKDDGHQLGPDAWPIPFYGPPAGACDPFVCGDSHGVLPRERWRGSGVVGCSDRKSVGAKLSPGGGTTTSSGPAAKKGGKKNPLGNGGAGASSSQSATPWPSKHGPPRELFDWTCHLFTRVADAVGGLSAGPSLFHVQLHHGCVLDLLEDYHSARAEVAAGNQPGPPLPAAQSSSAAGNPPQKNSVQQEVVPPPGASSDLLRADVALGGPGATCCAFSEEGVAVAQHEDSIPQKKSKNKQKRRQAMRLQTELVEQAMNSSGPNNGISSAASQTNNTLTPNFYSTSTTSLCAPRPADFSDFSRDPCFTGFDRIVLSNIPDYTGHLQTLLLCLPALNDRPNAFCEMNTRLNTSLFTKIAEQVRATTFLEKPELEQLLNAQHCLGGMWYNGVRWRKAILQGELRKIASDAVDDTSTERPTRGRGKKNAAAAPTIRRPNIVGARGIATTCPKSTCPLAAELSETGTMSRRHFFGCLSAVLLNLCAPAEQDPMASIRVTLPSNVNVFFRLLEQQCTSKHYRVWGFEFAERLIEAILRGGRGWMSIARPPDAHPPNPKNRFRSQEAELDLSRFGLELRALALLWGPHWLATRITSQEQETPTSPDQQRQSCEHTKDRATAEQTAENRCRKLLVDLRTDAGTVCLYRVKNVVPFWNSGDVEHRLLAAAVVGSNWSRSNDDEMQVFGASNKLGLSKRLASVGGPDPPNLRCGIFGVDPEASGTGEECCCCSVGKIHILSC